MRLDDYVRIAIPSRKAVNCMTGSSSAVRAKTNDARSLPLVVDQLELRGRGPEPGELVSHAVQGRRLIVLAVVGDHRGSATAPRPAGLRLGREEPRTIDDAPA
eukprot:254711-Pyramimonas_sp.AAC.1